MSDINNIFVKEKYISTNFYSANGQVSPTAGLNSQVLKHLNNTSQTRKISNQKTAPDVR